MKHGQTNKPFATAPTDPTKRHAKKLPGPIALPPKAAKNHSSLISFGSVVALTGFILSGPVGFAFVQLVKPLPRWTSAADFAAHYNALQNIPYYFGFILVGGMLILSTAHYLQAENALP
ncbi:MAG TPA: hypothetical protein VFL47_00375, partial [Flavisolibacter sp.]|nr:hypothetical protein [Flavisolibacter sp.]